MWPLYADVLVLHACRQALGHRRMPGRAAYAIQVLPRDYSAPHEPLMRYTRRFTTCHHGDRHNRLVKPVSWAGTQHLIS